VLAPRHFLHQGGRSPRAPIRPSIVSKPGGASNGSNASSAPPHTASSVAWTLNLWPARHMLWQPPEETGRSPPSGVANDLSPISSCPRKAPTGSSLGILGCRDDHQEFQSDPTPEPHHARALAPEADDRSFRQTASDQFVLVARRHFSLGFGGGVSTCTAGTDFR
jgi:hypothetical protein